MIGAKRWANLLGVRVKVACVVIACCVLHGAGGSSYILGENPSWNYYLCLTVHAPALTSRPTIKLANTRERRHSAQHINKQQRATNFHTTLPRNSTPTEEQQQHSHSTTTTTTTSLPPNHTQHNQQWVSCGLSTGAASTPVSMHTLTQLHPPTEQHH